MLIAGLGGFVGTCLRFLTGKIFHFAGSEAFPWGTFTVNLIGSFVIGIFFGMAEKTHLISPSMNVFLITGFCGGFTTFSSFSDDMYLLLQKKNPIARGKFKKKTGFFGCGQNPPFCRMRTVICALYRKGRNSRR